MHIAVCIDNTANRKQMERLLHRASDKQPADKVYYIDSFGSVSAVMCKPKLYDLFLLDIVEADTNGLTLAFMLRSAGVTCPIVLCPDKVDYRSQIEELNKEDAEIASSFLFLDQPVKVAELDKILEHAQVCFENSIPTMELRSDNYTIYAREEEFLYATQEKERILVRLTKDRQIAVFGQLYNLYEETMNFSNLLLLTDSCMVHRDYIDSIGFMSVKLKNGATVHTGRRVIKLLKDIL